jgi:hypothetical protein
VVILPVERPIETKQRDGLVLFTAPRLYTLAMFAVEVQLRAADEKNVTTEMNSMREWLDGRRVESSCARVAARQPTPPSAFVMASPPSIQSE